MAAKDKVIRPFRPPFSGFIEKGSPGEVEEGSRGTRVQKASGDLVTCPIPFVLGFPPYWASFMSFSASLSMQEALLWHADFGNMRGHA
jgi:Protein of unknown function (DUF1360)